MASGITVWDEQLEAIYGLPPGGFDGTFEAWLATVHPDDREYAMGVVQQALEARSAYVLRNRMFFFAASTVVRNPRENCCAVATGMTSRALTRSSPTVRIATLTETAASTEMSTL